MAQAAEAAAWARAALSTSTAAGSPLTAARSRPIQRPAARAAPLAVRRAGVGAGCALSAVAAATEVSAAAAAPATGQVTAATSAPMPTDKTAAAGLGLAAPSLTRAALLTSATAPWFRMRRLPQLAYGL